MELPEFEDFIAYMDDHADELFGDYQQMELVELHWPLDQNEFRNLIAMIEKNAIRKSGQMTIRYLQAYHEYLRSLP